MGDKTDVWQGTLALMVLKTIETMGPLHGYGIARRIEQTSGNLLSLNYGTLYPALLKLEQEGSIASEWGVSENNRKAKFYKLTRAGRRQLRKGGAQLGADHRHPRALSRARRRSRYETPSRLDQPAYRPVLQRSAASTSSPPRLEGHLQLHIDDNLRAGMTPEAARRDAILKLGGLEPTTPGLSRARHGSLLRKPSAGPPLRLPPAGQESRLHLVPRS